MNNEQSTPNVLLLILNCSGSFSFFSRSVLEILLMLKNKTELAPNYDPFL